jgi:hypothetical protein
MVIGGMVSKEVWLWDLVVGWRGGRRCGDVGGRDGRPKDDMNSGGYSLVRMCGIVSYTINLNYKADIRLASIAKREFPTQRFLDLAAISPYRIAD